MALVEPLKRHISFLLGFGIATLIIAVLGAILGFGYNWLHIGPAERFVRVIYLPEQPGFWEKYQTLVSGIFATIGGAGAVVAGVLAYRGAILSADKTASSAIKVAEMAAAAADADRRHRNEYENNMKIATKFEKQQTAVLLALANLIKYRSRIQKRQSILEAIDHQSFIEVSPENMTDIISAMLMPAPETIISGFDPTELGQCLWTVASKDALIAESNSRYITWTNIIMNLASKRHKNGHEYTEEDSDDMKQMFEQACKYHSDLIKDVDHLANYLNEVSDIMGKAREIQIEA